MKHSVQDKGTLLLALIGGHPRHDGWPFRQGVKTGGLSRSARQPGTLPPWSGS